MENKMNTEKKNGLFTAKRFKIGAAVVIVCAVVAGIGAWYHHQQKIERRAQIRQAQTRMVEYQAEQRNMVLIGEEKVRCYVVTEDCIYGSPIALETIVSRYCRLFQRKKGPVEL